LGEAYLVQRKPEEAREYEQARAYYQQALDIKIEFGDRYNQASTYHQLGRVAQELREYEQARAYYQQALDIKIKFGDRYAQAGTYHNLGIVAQELREYEQAKLYYHQALDIYIEFSDRYSQASTYPWIIVGAWHCHALLISCAHRITCLANEKGYDDILSSRLKRTR